MSQVLEAYSNITSTNSPFEHDRLQMALYIMGYRPPRTLSTILGLTKVSYHMRDFVEISGSWATSITHREAGWRICMEQYYNLLLNPESPHHWQEDSIQQCEVQRVQSIFQNSTQISLVAYPRTKGLSKVTNRVILERLKKWVIGAKGT